MSEYTIRHARQDDFEGVLKLLEARQYADLPIRNLTREQRREAAIAGYRENWGQLEKEEQLEVLVAERHQHLAGVLVLITGLHESITYDNQTMIYDHFVGVHEDRAGVLQALFERGEVLARDAGGEFVVVELKLDDPDEELFGQLGYTVELNRIGKRTEVHDLRFTGDYSVRPATRDDQMYIIYLNGLVNKYTIPAGRDGDPDDVASRYLDAYFDLNVGPGGDAQGYLCLVGPDDAPAGYLMIKTGFQEIITGQEIAYIYDLALHPDHWGKRATQLLMRTVETRLCEQGYDLFTGDISENNQRALHTSIKSLGFTLEWRRWGKRLEPLLCP